MANAKSEIRAERVRQTRGRSALGHSAEAHLVPRFLGSAIKNQILFSVPFAPVTPLMNRLGISTSRAAAQFARRTVFTKVDPVELSYDVVEPPKVTVPDQSLVITHGLLWVCCLSRSRIGINDQWL